MIAAALVLAVSAPVIVAIALAIVIESPGPVLYRARRVGRGGVEFDMLKFRKMSPRAGGPKLTRADDARFTRVGRFLAATKLDELPQLFNVLAGQMSLVGPRPEDPAYAALFPEDYATILTVPPGITGPTQLMFVDESALLERDDFEDYYRTVLLPQKIQSDLEYVRGRSARYDLLILCHTARAALGGFNVRWLQGRSE